MYEGTLNEKIITRRAIKIIHDKSNKIDFIFLSEFFKMLGFFVGEEKTEAKLLNLSYDEWENEVREEADYDAYIFAINESCINDFKISKNSSSIFLCKIKYEQEVKVESNNNNSIISYSVANQKKILRSLIQTMAQIVTRNFFNIKTELHLEEFNEIADIYVDCDIMKQSANLQYYYNRKSDQIQTVKEKFLEAYIKLSGLDLNKKTWSEKYYRFAILWCAVKTNCSCNCNQQILYFPTQELSERCRTLCIDFPDFSNAKVLVGLSYEPSKECAIEAVNAFKLALPEINKYCYSSCIYYWIGKRHEAFSTEANQNKAEEYFMKAYNKQKKFRNIFKVAVYEKKHEKYKESIESFIELLKALDCKWDEKTIYNLNMEYMDPLELEYAFKASVQISYLYFKIFNDSLNAIQFAVLAERIRMDKIDEDDFYNDFYGPEADSFRKLSKDRMNMRNIYAILATAYRQLRDKDSAESYMKKMENIYD